MKLMKAFWEEASQPWPIGLVALTIQRYTEPPGVPPSYWTAVGIEGGGGLGVDGFGGGERRSGVGALAGRGSGFLGGGDLA